LITEVNNFQLTLIEIAMGVKDFEPHSSLAVSSLFPLKLFLMHGLNLKLYTEKDDKKQTYLMIPDDKS
jgi:hypothetical protein